MGQQPPDGGIPEVPKQVFEKFLAELGKSGVADDVVARLRNALFDARGFNEAALRAALFPADQPL